MHTNRHSPQLPSVTELREQLHYLLYCIRMSMTHRWVSIRHCVHAHSLLVVLGFFLAMLLPYLSYIPMWDGQGYALCIMDTPLFPLSIEHSRCFGHPSMAYVWLQRVAQLLSPGSIKLIFLTNLALASYAGVEFHRLLRSLFPEAPALQLAASVALLLFTPVLTVHVFHVAPDFGVVPFFTIYLSFLLRQKYWQAGLAGLALAFSKEAGTGVYLASLLALPFLLAPDIRRCTKTHALRFCRTLFPVFIPALCIVLYFKIQSSSGSTLGVWEGFDGGSDLWIMLLSIDFANTSFTTFLFDIFALNFQWILTATLVIAMVVTMFRVAAGSPHHHSVDQVSRIVFLSLMLLASAYVVTRMRPWNNARYTLAYVPVLVLLFNYALQSLHIRAEQREVFLSAVATLFFVSNFFTIDPISRWYFKVFQTGQYSMLDMKRMGESTASFGRDEMAYNLEFLSVTDALRKILNVVKPSPDTVFFAGEGFNAQLPFVKRSNGSLTLDRSDSFSLAIVEDPGQVPDLAARQQEQYFVSFPNLENNNMQSALLQHGKLVKIPSDSWDEHGVHLYRFMPRAV